ncbi:hypothetical protein [Xenorhabdus hominickii]|nr:hypothetical protein [Xenorhabdus hominickii]
MCSASKLAKNSLKDGEQSLTRRRAACLLTMAYKTNNRFVGHRPAI